MTNQFTNSAVAYLRNKLAAAAEEMHEAAESPEQEALEHASGAGEGSEAHEEGAGGLEHLLSQLSPEELEQLASELSGDIQHPEAAQGGEDVASLAKAISEHLGQSPEANMLVSNPEKQAAFNFVKSASYIHGFLNQAVHDGVGMKTAVDLYDSSLALTIQNLKTAELKGKQHKLDVNSDGKIDASDLRKLRANKHEKSESSKEEMEEHKTAAYYAGVFERASEYGIPEHIVKQASAEAMVDGTANVLKDYIDKVRGVMDKGVGMVESAGPAMGGYGRQAVDYLGAHPGQAVGGGAALGAGGLLALQQHLKKKKEQELMQQLM